MAIAGPQLGMLEAFPLNEKEDEIKTMDELDDPRRSVDIEVMERVETRMYV